MAQTKRKRPSKHRGNAAGMIEARGRPGSKPAEGEKRSRTGPADATASKRPKTAAEKKAARYDTPPTWRGAINKALIASLFVVGASILILNYKPSQMLGVLPIILVVYIPLGYYTDMFIYRRRKQKKGG